MVTGKTEAPPAVGLDEALAPELWCFVCGFLPAASIAALGATNRRLREVVRSAPAWRGTEFVVASESAFDVVRDAWGGCVGELCLRGSWVDDAVVASCSDATFPFLVSLAITRSSGLGLVAFDHCRLRELTLRRLTCLRVVAVGCPSLVSLTVSADLSVLDSVLVESRTTSAGADSESESEGESAGESAGDRAVGQADRCAPSTLTRLVVRQDPALQQRPDSPRLERLPSLLVDASGLEVLAMPVPTWPTGPAGILRLLRASPRLRCLTLTGKADPGEALWVTTEVAEGRVPAQLRDHARSCKCHTDEANPDQSEVAGVSTSLEHLRLRYVGAFAWLPELLQHLPRLLSLEAVFPSPAYLSDQWARRVLAPGLALAPSALSEAVITHHRLVLFRSGEDHSGHRAVLWSKIERDARLGACDFRAVLPEGVAPSDLRAMRAMRRGEAGFHVAWPGPVSTTSSSSSSSSSFRSRSFSSTVGSPRSREPRKRRRRRRRRREHQRQTHRISGQGSHA